MLLFTNLFKRDSDPHSEKLPDPDPQKMNADPQPCLCPNFFLENLKKKCCCHFCCLAGGGSQERVCDEECGIPAGHCSHSCRAQVSGTAVLSVFKAKS